MQTNTINALSVLGSLASLRGLRDWTDGHGHDGHQGMQLMVLMVAGHDDDRVMVMATPTSVDFQAVKAMSKKATLSLTILLQYCNNTCRS